jgi:hypothetical protein
MEEGAEAESAYQDLSPDVSAEGGGGGYMDVAGAGEDGFGSDNSDEEV